MPDIKTDQQPQSIAEQNVADELLRQTQLIVDNSRDAIIGETLDGVITSWNGGAARMFGYSASEVIGKSFLFLVPIERKDEILLLLNKIRAGEAIADYDSIRLCKDGSKIYVALSASPVKTENGVVIGVSIVERDITERKKEEESLRQIKLIVENSHDAIIGETLDGVITSWNGGAVRMFDYSKQEMIGKPMINLFPLELKSELPNLLARVKNGEIIADYDSIWLRKDNSLADVEFSLSPVKSDVEFSISPVKSETGDIIGASLVGRDISKRKREEESLRQIHLIVENSHDAIIGETLSGIVTSWNGGAVRMFDYSKQEMIGKSMTNLFPPELKDELPGLLDKVKNGEIIADYDSIWLRKDGSRADVEFSISPLKSDTGDIIGASLVGRDISKRKKDERHINELNEVRSKFIDVISHQLRTPLTAINWNLEMLINNSFGKMDDTQHKFLQVTYSSSIEITHRINDLLTAIDVEEGRVRYVTEEVVLNSICVGAMNDLLKKADMKNISFVYEPPTSDLPVIHGDGEKIRMIVAVLLKNAIDYTRDGGKIIMKLLAKSNVVRFEVIDTGVGIPQAEQHLIFNRFFRASNASVMQQDAFGLGLYVVKNFVEQHHGVIGFESEEGKGSMFWFELPIKNQI